MPLVVREISWKYPHLFIFTLKVHLATSCCRKSWGTGWHFFQGILALRCHQLVPGKSPATTESCAAADQAPIVRYEEEPTTQTPKPSSTNSRKRKKRFHNQTIKEQVRKTIAPGYSWQVARGILGCIFIQVGEHMGEDREAQCPGPFPSTGSLALWFQIRNISEQ